MTKQQAKKVVLRTLAITLQYDLDNGSGWIYTDQESLGDVQRIESAIKEVRNELERRSEGAPDSKKKD